MGKVLMLFASQSGNTELMAESMVEYIEKQGYDVETRAFDFDPIEAEDIPDYDAIAIGTHTWDAGDLPYEVEDFYEELDDVNIEGKIFGVFGSADAFYDVYGGAVELMWERLNEKGANLVQEKLKVDLEPNDKDIERCRQFAANFCSLIEASQPEKNKK